MSENVIKYKGQYLSYSEIADELILNYGCNSLEQLPTLIYLGTGEVLCQSEANIITNLYNFRVERVKTLLLTHKKQIIWIGIRIQSNAVYDVVENVKRRK